MYHIVAERTGGFVVVESLEPGMGVGSTYKASGTKLTPVGIQARETDEITCFEKLGVTCNILRARVNLCSLYLSGSALNATEYQSIFEPLEAENLAC